MKLTRALALLLVLGGEGATLASEPSTSTAAPAPSGSLRDSLSLGSALRREALPPPTSTASSSAASPPLTAEVLQRAEKEWETVLELGRQKGPSENREEMARWSRDGSAPWVRALADTFLDEWRIKSGDPRLQQPRRVWIEPLPVLKLKGSARQIDGVSEVDRRGKVLRIDMHGSTGSTEADFEIEKWARTGRYRPAMEGFSWVSGKAAWRLGG